MWWEMQMTRSATVGWIGALIGAALIFAGVPAEAARRKARVAVIPITSSHRAVARSARKASRKMIKRLRRSRRYRVVVLPARRARSMRRCLQQPSCIQTLSRRYRVRYLMAGHAERVGRRVHVDMRVISGSTGTVLASASYATRRGRAMVYRSSRLAYRLIRKAQRRPRRSAPNKFAPEVVTRSDAEATAAVIEERDKEDPNAPPAEEPKKLAKADLEAGQDPLIATDPLAPTLTKRSDGAGLWSRRYWHAWTAAGAGLGALAAGGVFAVISSRANKEAHAAELQVDAWTARDKARKNALAANVMFAAGGASVVTSLVLFYLEHKQVQKERRAARLRVGVNVAQGGGALLLKGKF